jgi:hypothetical protein
MLVGGLKLQIGAKQAIMKYRMDDDAFYYKCKQPFERFGMRRESAAYATDGADKTESNTSEKNADSDTPPERIIEDKANSIEHSGSIGKLDCLEVKVGDIIQFGFGENNDKDWRVIAIKENCALILLDSVFAAYHYNDYADILQTNYADSSIRKGLTTSFPCNFSDLELSRIRCTELTDRDRSINDAFFLLSEEDARKYLSEPSSRLIKNDYSHYGWWLRGSLSLPDKDVPKVNHLGEIEKTSIDDVAALRPACWIRLIGKEDTNI